MMEHLSQIFLMLLCPDFWTRHREAWIMGQDVRLSLFILLDLVVGHPIEALRYAAGELMKILPFAAAINILCPQRPKAALFRWAVTSMAQLWFCLYVARPGVGAFEGLLYRARVERGLCLVWVSTVFAAVQLVLGMLAAWKSDLSCRKAFARHHDRLQEGED